MYKRAHAFNKSGALVGSDEYQTFLEMKILTSSFTFPMYILSYRTKSNKACIHTRIQI